MKRIVGNSGVVNYGSGNVTNSAVGDGATVNVGGGLPEAGERPRPRLQAPQEAWDVGIVTVLSEETAELIKALGLKRDEDGPRRPFFYTGEVAADGRPARAVAVRTIGQGQRACMGALENLRRHYDPALLALVGIGGGVHDGVALGDVVVGTRVVYYDLRKETGQGTRHRGEEREAPADVLHSVNAFFTEHGEPALLPAASAGGTRDGGFKAHHGPIGSGDAVIADEDNENRRFLRGYNDKVLAVDMEAGGLSQFCQENSVGSGRTPGWVVVRGISDHADRRKGDSHHAAAARNAASVLRRLIPYLL
ncbi:5'-methylthioadenosine/S-adenosylhomocysteine nucleosidase family protein [Nocardiopsis potens]|uniref:5'-methylthioadenosine/S-adenosylhomocysteine nucleosidase family protein n=1 Tax=Nocardiopsis potens TaxID=1246458 RepID=UPI0019D3DB92|nr:5'-methylthioadenosine/S-adenosylhomocysteine nucleosidase [Nocardiopsis potens]